MKSQIFIELSEIMATKLGAIDPSKYPDELFDLYSIPAFDQGQSVVIPGNQIGSSKQIVQTDDVMLSKIVPHIRRAWIVGHSKGYRTIASGEWIVFRSTKFDNGYLRQVLVSDPFNKEFMGTVAGVGGSLLRARPAHVAKIKIPLPPLPEQRRIAAILDKAEALRAKRRAALAKLDQLTQSIFLEMFGDPETNPKEVPVTFLSNLCQRITDGTHQSPKWSVTGCPFLFVSNIVSGEICFVTEKFISNETQAELTKRCPIDVGDILYSTVGSYGVPAIVRSSSKFAFQRHIAHIKPNQNLINSIFLKAMLASPPLKRQADRAAKGVAQKTVNLSEIQKFVVFSPPLPIQQAFAKRIEAIESLKAAHRASLAKLDALFASLQHRAFRGEL